MTLYDVARTPNLAQILLFFGPNPWPKFQRFWPKFSTFLAQIITLMAQIITFLAQITTFLVHILDIFLVFSIFICAFLNFDIICVALGLRPVKTDIIYLIEEQ